MALTTANINFAPDASAGTSDDDATCTGTAAAPTAPAGKMCLYLYGNAPIPAAITSVNGFEANNLGNQSVYVLYTVGAGTGTNIRLFLTWAYTAP